MIVDRLVGSYHMPRNYWPAEYGTTVRLPRGYVAQILDPFKKLLQRK